MTANHAALLRRVAAEATDRDLLIRFAVAHDGEAFAELVRRYGSAVLGVCQRITGQRQDAEDAFQAVFVILARRANTLQKPELLGNWLYGVAVRVARKARRSAGRRRVRETTVAVMPEPVVEPLPPSDLGSVLDEELAALPEWYSDAVLLCDLYGHSRTEAAARLGIPEGTLSSRLAAGRKKLADRLARRGVTASMGSLIAVIVPSELASAAVDAALAGVTGSPLAAGIESLTHDGGFAMNKFVGWVAALVATVGVGVGAVLAFSPPVSDEPTKPPVADADSQKQDKPVPKPEAAPVKPVVGKAKLLGTVEFADGFGGPHWDPNGEFLLVHRGHEFGFWNQKSTRIHGVASLTRGMQFVGLTRDEPELFTYTNAGARVNAQTGLFAHNLHSAERRPPARQEIYEPNVARVTELEVDDGIPVAVLRRGKAVLAIKQEMKRNPKVAEKAPKKGNPFPGARGPGGFSPLTGSEPREVLDTTCYRLIDTTTGEVKPDIVKVPAGPKGEITPFAVSHLHNQLIVAFQVDNGVAIEAYDFTDGKKVWRKLIEPKGPAMKYSPNQLMVSPEGRYLAITYMRNPEPPQPPPEDTGGGNPFGGGGRRNVEPFTTNRTGMVIFDLSTDGPEVGPKVPDFGVGEFRLASISLEARLLAISHYDGVNRTMQVWDTATGKRIKYWNGRAELAFHPTKPLLAALERVTEYLDDNRPVSKSVLGIWDFSEFVKP